MFDSTRTIHCGIAAFALGVSGAVEAQEAGDDAIIVTAQRRDQRLVEVPVSVSVVDHVAIHDQGLREISDITSRTPGLTGEATGLTVPSFAIRGISTASLGVGGEASVGVFQDGQYLGRLESSNIPFFDIDHVEVLKGPQSTLFGRNASAGAISIATRRPGPTFSMDASLLGADPRWTEGRLALDLPASDRLRTRLAYLHRSIRGTEFNTVDRQHEGGDVVDAVRGTVVAQAGPLTATLIGNYVSDNGGGFPSETLDSTLSAIGSLPADPFDGRHATDAPTYERRRIATANLQLSLPVGSSLTLETITAYQRTTLDRQFDIDGSSLPLFTARYRGYRDESVDQQVRLQITTPLVTGFIGGSWSRERIGRTLDASFSDEALLAGVTFPADSIFPGQPFFSACEGAISTAILGLPCNPAAKETSVANGRYDTLSAMGDLRWRVTDRIGLTTGGRLSLDRKRYAYETTIGSSVSALLYGGSVFVSPTSGVRRYRREWTAFQPRFVFDYRFDDGLVWASASKGFKAGGFDSARDTTRVPFAPETTWSLELGYRHVSPALTYSVVGYLATIDGYQMQVVKNGITATLNTGKVRSRGVEGEFLWRPINRLELSGAASWNTAEFRDLVTDAGDLSGNRLPYAPGLTLSGTLKGTMIDRQDWALSAIASVRSYSRQFFTMANDPDEGQAGRAVVDAGIIVDAHDIRLRVFARNLLDRRYLIYAIDQGFGIVANRGAPRTVGAEISVSF
ncbi:TonB-dependent receptor [Sphingobium yanoikuyae]|uniref:TonB-dependent receptor n=1 Tax=Sphingobium yanoikuyae TaxID=13690 RepID=A0A291MYB6_SPHYA|nr:TonB-dependent receptor [Sphingobium yanoikuyae]ATI79991.1 hypothetical protein A6768_08210 [Sphingobium yanoikuyae]